MNRGMVKQLLLQELTRDITPKLTRIQEKIIGEEEQRPFDSASLEMQWENEALIGAAALRSSNLELTLDLSADEGSIRTAIESQQKMRLEDMLNFRAEPLQFDDE